MARTYASLAPALTLALLLASTEARAERFLVQFRSTEGALLVARGERPDGLAAEAGDETRKRVEARAVAIATARDDLLGSLPSDVVSALVSSYRHFPLLRMELDEVARLEVEAHPQVVAVHRDRLRHLSTDSSLDYLGASRWHEAGWTGEGTSVAVLDTGIRYWNGFFGACPSAGAEGCRVTVFEGFATLAFGTGTTDPREVAELESHGTNVGGIVGDVAPGADLISLGVFAYYDADPASGSRGGASATDGDVAEALDWCIEHQAEHRIVAANMSLGSDPDPTETGYCRGWMAGAYAAVFANARDAGILPVVATGNEYLKTAVSSPACVAAAVRVGAGYDDPAYGYECGTGPVVPGAVTCFSNSNALVDLVAPGNDLDAGGILGLSGTSMAAPHVAGLVATYAARYRTSPFWTLERIRADAVPVTEIGPAQTYVHRYARMGGHQAELTFDTGAVLASDFEGIEIPDDGPEGLVLSAEVACESELCASDVVGNVYLDLGIDHEGTGDLVIELEGPDGTVVRHEVEGDDELGLEHVNSILGSQHLPGLFEALSGGPIVGTWTLRLFDRSDRRRGKLFRAALLVDSARVELGGEIEASAVGRPGEPFEAALALVNRGNLEVSTLALALELVELETGAVVDQAPVAPELPWMPGDERRSVVRLEGPQGTYELRLVAESLEPDLPPGLVVEPVAVSVSYRTFASFVVEPERPQPGEPVRLTVVSRGLVESCAWDFGDGLGSSEESPSHVFDREGDYEIALVVHGPDGRSRTARTVRVRALPGGGLDVRGGGLSCSAARAAPCPSRAGLALGLLALGLCLGRLRRRRAAGAVVLVLALSGAACGPAGGLPDGGVPEPGEPWLSLLDPEDPSAGDLTVWVMVSSAEASSCDLALDYRLGRGEFAPATLVGPEAAAGLPSGPGGLEHGLLWLSTEDVRGDEREVQLRARADCGGEDTLSVTSGAFTLLNFLVTHPRAVLVTEVSAADDNVPAPIQSDYVELVNTTDERISLDGWTLSVAAAGGRRTDHRLEGAALEPAGRLVVAELGSSIDGALELDQELPWTVQTGGAVWLVASFDRPVDFVRWGGSPVPPPAGLAWTDEPPLPVPQTLTVLGRVEDAIDTDSSADFCVSRPTPGAAGEGCIRAYQPSDLLVTELNTQGMNDQIEVLNASHATIDLGGWMLLWDGDDLGAGRIPLGSHLLAPGERLVLMDNGRAGRVSGGIMELGDNLNIDGLVPIAIAVQDPHGTVVDFVAAGGSRVRWLEWDETEPTPMPGPRTTLSRRPSDPDTDSAADFCLTEPNLGRGASECLEPLGLRLVITEVNPGRPDWVEIWNPGEEAVDLSRVYLSYTSPYFGGSVGDYRLSGTLEPGAFLVVSERALEGVEGELVVEARIQIAPEGDASIALRDIYGFGIDFVMWGEPAGTPLWPDTWPGLGLDKHAESSSIVLQRRAHDGEDTDSREDWCWGLRASPMEPNRSCE